MTLTFKKLQVTKLSSDFTAATQVVDAVLRPPADDEILVKILFAGVNAGEVNITAGRYFTDAKVPFDIGLEGLGLVQEVGCDIRDMRIGQSVLTLGAPAYAEYVYAKRDQVFAVPSVKPQYLVTLINGLSACIALDEPSVNLKPGDKVLITAAAGGTGHMAVQWAKRKGCFVIGTTSSYRKAKYLESIGVDHVINYKSEDLDSCLSRDFPKGIDVIWETLGGKVMDLLMEHLAEFGRMLVIGSTVTYKDDGFPDVPIPISAGKLLMKSQQIIGFLIFSHRHRYEYYLEQLITAIDEGSISAKVDLGKDSIGGSFNGIADAQRAVEYVHSGQNIGKVVVKIQ